MLRLSAQNLGGMGGPGRPGADARHRPLGSRSVCTGSEMIGLKGNDGNQSFAANGLNEATAYGRSTETLATLEMPIDLTLVMFYGPVPKSSCLE